VRIAEFDDLFATGLRGLQRMAPTRLHPRFDAAAEATGRGPDRPGDDLLLIVRLRLHPAADGELLPHMTVP
jgi:hypothetical protein